VGLLAQQVWNPGPARQRVAPALRLEDLIAIIRRALPLDS
jgi:hypothetical protein